MLSTWTHAPSVMENDYLTLKQKQINVAATKHSCPLMQTCDTLKTAPAHIKTKK
jgi:hypothetical protein